MMRDACMLLAAAALCGGCDAPFRDSYPCSQAQPCLAGDQCSTRTGTCFVQPLCGGDACGEEQVCEEPLCVNDTQWARYPIVETPSVTVRGNTLVDSNTGLTWALDALPPASDGGCAGHIGSVNDVLTLVTLDGTGAHLPVELRWGTADGGSGAPRHVVTNIAQCEQTACSTRWAVAVGDTNALVTTVDSNTCVDCWRLCVVGGQ